MSGEVMTTSIGLGQTLIMGRDLADINQVMLIMIIIIIVGAMIDKVIFSKIERKILSQRGLL
jgi:NitT/TauT family transport system permease protein